MNRILACLLLLSIAACAPESQPQLASTTAPALSGLGFTASDGSALTYRAWLPAGETKAVIVAVHGFNDYSHGYEMPGEYLRLCGIALFSYDQRGFGTTAPHGIWAGEANLVRDTDDMLTAVRAIYPQTPLYLLGESMGGAVAILAATEPGLPKVDGVILSAPAVTSGTTINPFLRFALWGAAHVTPAKQVTGMDFHILASDNIDMLRDLSLDPLFIKKTRIDAIYGLVQLMDKAYENIDKIKAPTLLLYGANDQLVPPEPIRKALARMPPWTTASYYPLGFHMLLRDLHGDMPVRDIVSWIAGPAAPLPSRGDKLADKYLK